MAKEKENKPKKEKESNEESIPENVLFNRQVNYLLISKLWKFLNPRTAVSQLYNMLGIKPNYYSRIITADTYNIPNLDTKWKENSPNGLHVLGLPKEYMVGNKMIEIEGIDVGDWEDYISARYDKENKQQRTWVMDDFNKKLIKAFKKLDYGGLNGTSRNPIDMLYYFFKTNTKGGGQSKDIEIVNLKKSLKMVQTAHWKECDRKLLQQVIEIMRNQLEIAEVIEKYNSYS